MLILLLVLVLVLVWTIAAVVLFVDQAFVVLFLLSVDAGDEGEPLLLLLVVFPLPLPLLVPVRKKQAECGDTASAGDDLEVCALTGRFVYVVIVGTYVVGGGGDDCCCVVLEVLLRGDIIKLDARDVALLLLLRWLFVSGDFL